MLSSSTVNLTSPVGGGGGASHLLDASSGFPGAFHRSSFASFSERLAGNSSSQQQQAVDSENRTQDMQCRHSNSKHQTPNAAAAAAVGSEILTESEGISDINNRYISAMSAR